MPHEFGRMLLHLAQCRGALGLKLADVDELEDGEASDDGKVKAAIGEVCAKMKECDARTFGEFIATIRAERVTPITTPDTRPVALIGRVHVSIVRRFETRRATMNTAQTGK